MNRPALWFLMLLAVVLGLLPRAVAAQCRSCAPPGGPPHAPAGIPAYVHPGDYDGEFGFGGSPYGCDHGCYVSEQERLFFDFCRDCQFNWGRQFTDANALTPRFKPAWYAMADALFLARDKINDVPFASRGPGLRNAVLGTDDLEVELEGGGRLLVVHSLAPHLLVEGTFFGLHRWDETESVRDVSPNALGGTGNLFSPFSDFGQPPLPGFDFNTLATITESSDVHNAEINLRHRFGLLCCPLETTVLYGVRYMRIEESFEYFTQANVPAPAGAANFLHTRTKNDLLGFQLGGLAGYRVSDRWWIEFDLKAALCQNNAEQQTTFITAPQQVPQTFEGQRQRGSTAFIGELMLSSNYQLTRFLAVRAGYQAIWADGLALASENASFDPVVLTLGPPRIHDNGTLVYHGPHLGMIVQW